MTLNENKLKKGKQLNKRYKTRLNFGTVSYQREEPSSLITNHNLYIREMVDYERRVNKKTKKNEIKRSIKIEAKKDVMDGILTEITDKQKKEKDEEEEEDINKVNPNKKKKKKKQVTKTIFIHEVDKSNEMKEDKPKTGSKKKLVITADLKPDGKKGELVL